MLARYPGPALLTENMIHLQTVKEFRAPQRKESHELINATIDRSAEGLTNSGVRVREPHLVMLKDFF